jgi:transcriptional regulator with XRE-family HTH domain
MKAITREQPPTLGQSARKVRLALHLSQQELAALTGVSRDAVYQFEHHLPVILDARRRILKELWAIKTASQKARPSLPVTSPSP